LEFGRYRGIADIEQAIAIKRFMSTRPNSRHARRSSLSCADGVNLSALPGIHVQRIPAGLRNGSKTSGKLMDVLDDGSLLKP